MQAADSARRSPQPRAAAAALAALGLAAFCYITGESLPVGLLPQLSAGLHSSLSATGLLVTVYAAVVVAASVPLTQLTRNVPRRILLSGLLATFALGTLGCAAAPTYGWLLAARVLTALSQAVFWAVAAVTAAGLFSPEARARAVAGVFGGSAVGVVLGIPAGTWIGQQAGWRVPFVVLSAIGVLSLCAVATLVPTSRPSESHAAAGAHPDARRYRILVATTMLAVAAFYTAFTYVSPFLTRVSGFAHRDVAAVLLASGLASTIGIVAGGALYSRRPRGATIAPVALLVPSLFGLYLFGTAGLPAAACQALDGLALGGLIVTMQTGVLVVAPRSTDIASAWFSAAFNVGIAGGPLVGAALLSSTGLRSTAIGGGVLAAAALAILLAGERWRPSRQRGNDLLV